MGKLIINGLVYKNAERAFLPLDILCEGDKIAAIEEKGSITPDGHEVFDAAGRLLIPGLIDVHTHGRDGYDFNTADIENMKKMAEGYASSGVTTVMPTLASAPFEEIMRAAERINNAIPSEKGAAFCGVHLEGRYLNPAKKGAHALEYLAALDANELCAPELEQCRALHISAAYELDGDGSFSAKAKELGATLALGHTCATYAEARKAEERGVSAYAHLFNAMPPLHHREGGAVAACLTGNAYAEMICDGIHIAPEMVALAYRCKGEKLSLVSDSMEATGAPDGEYSIAGNPVTVKDGKALTHDGALAGSTLTLDVAVRNLMRFCDIPLCEAIICATEAPAKEVGIFDTCGSIDAGKRADLLIIDSDTEDFKIEKIMLRGRFI